VPGPLGTVAALRGALDTREASARELAERALARAAALDPRLHAFVSPA
jgi:Asp-tRNA(Asn)/Glu-tRNA(Gln) amidotransferase A subunit family amidase